MPCVFLYSVLGCVLAVKWLRGPHPDIHQLMFNTVGVFGSILAWLWFNPVLCPLVCHGMECAALSLLACLRKWTELLALLMRMTSMTNLARHMKDLWAVENGGGVETASAALENYILILHHVVKVNIHTSSLAKTGLRDIVGFSTSLEKATWFFLSEQLIRRNMSTKCILFHIVCSDTLCLFGLYS